MFRKLVLKKKKKKKKNANFKGNACDRALFRKLQALCLQLFQKMLRH